MRLFEKSFQVQIIFLLVILFMTQLPAQNNTKSQARKTKTRAISVLKPIKQDSTIESGDTAEIRVKIDSSEKGKVNWYKKSFNSVKQVESSKDVSIQKEANESKLLITNFTKKNQAQYFAKLTFKDKEPIKSRQVGFRIPDKKEQLIIKEKSFQGSFPIIKNKKAVPFLISANDEKVVELAANSFQKDINSLTGEIPPIVNNIPKKRDKIIIAGSVKKSKYIQKLIEENKFDSYHIEYDQRESFIISVVDNPFPGVKKALVIAGSDPRGTAFGIFELSKKLGISPWVWWADADVDKKKSIYISKGNYEFGPPSVKHRGIFINDEDWSLTPWAARKYEPKLGNIGPKTYAKIFELLLRLKANHIWPAMHKCTIPFYKIPENQKVADKYSIIVGSSHTEVMLYNNASEWDHKKDGPWDYTRNSNRIKEVWRKRVKQTANSNTVYQMGIRGVHDTGMEGVSNYKEGAVLVSKIIQDQRNMLSNQIDKPIDKIPQVFTPYKEVMNYYDAGIELPEDITLMWVDDNYGHIRRFSNQKEQQRRGGGGIYYHLSYLGTPHPFLWVSTTSPTKIWREVKRAYQHNMKDNWIFNVGDIKRREWMMEFGLQLGWNIDRWNNHNIKDFFKQVASRDISLQYSDEIAKIMWEFHQLSAQRKPEHMGFSNHWNGSKQVQNPDFSLFNYGDEVQRRIDHYETLVQKAEKIYSKLDSKEKIPFYELVLYKVRGAANLNKKLLHAYKNKIYAHQGRYGANYHADKTVEAFKKIRQDTRFYNKELKNGKWNYLNDYRPGFYRGAKVFEEPDLVQYRETEETKLDVAIQGKKGTLSELDQQLELNKTNNIILNVNEANLKGNRIISGQDQKGKFIGLKDTNNLKLNFPNQEKAIFNFQIDSKQEGKYTLFAYVDHPTGANNSWFIKLDEQKRITWNDKVGSGRFKIKDYKLNKGSHTLKFYCRESGAKLRKIELKDHTSNELPEFNRYINRKYFIDIFKTGPEAVQWTATPNHPWLKLSAKEGRINQKGDRIWVSLDYQNLPQKSHFRGHIDIKHDKQKYRIYVPVFNEELNVDKNTHIQDNGVISINAKDYVDINSSNGYSWEKANGLGITRSAMILKPVSGWYIDNIQKVFKNSPVLEYDIRVTQGGKANLTLLAVPSFPVIQGKKLRCAISIDGRSPQWVNFRMGKSNGRLWEKSVAKNIMKGKIQTNLKSGRHTLQVLGTDPSINLSKIVFDFGGIKNSYLGPPSTLVK